MSADPRQSPAAEMAEAIGWRQAQDLEALYAQDGAAFTLRFTIEGQQLDLTFGGAVVGRLFQRWGHAGPRDGLRLIPLVSEGDAGGRETADAAFQFGECAPGYVHVRLSTGRGDIECRLEGRVGMDVAYPDHACERDADGRPPRRIDRDLGHAAVSEAELERLVSVSRGHGDRSPAPAGEAG